MAVLRWMQPRDHRAAGRSVSTLCAVAAGVTVVAAPFQTDTPPGPAEAAVAGALVVAVVAFGILARCLGETHRLVWVLGPLLAVAAITAIDLLTHDATVSAQIFFLFPALYGASQLRPAGAAVMTGASVLGEVVVVVTQLPLREAAVDAGYVAAVVVTASVLLTVSHERQARLVARLEQMAAVDPLTGLATRRVLDEAATSALSGASSDAGTALILIDVDHFKAINDRHGHPAGDDVLVQLADLLLGHRRPSDVACRLGGDEIAVLLPGCTHEAAVARADDILSAVRAHTFRATDGTDLPVSISLGCAHMPTHATGLAALYTAADAALYESKQGGRGRVSTAGRISQRS